MLTSELHIAAALSENVYRRSEIDNAIGLKDIGAREIFLSVSGLTRTPTDPYYYNDATGFVGSVTEVNGKIYVTYRGTDNGGGFFDIFVSQAMNFLGLSLGASNLSDPKDFTEANSKLSAGTTTRSQLDDALALYRAARTANPGKVIVVVGQSLGGGLAGLVAAIENVNGIAIDPAPFKKQVEPTWPALRSGRLCRTKPRPASANR